MANRILIGSDSQGIFRFRISKPGFNVMTAGEFDMLLSMDSPPLQFVTSGQVDLSGNGSGISRTVNIPNLGYKPIVLGAAYHGFEFNSASFEVQHLSNTLITLSRRSGDGSYNASNLILKYFVVAIPNE
jgi:hypothetical protein